MQFFATTAVIVSLLLAAGPFWFPALRRAILYSLPEKSEALDVLCDLLEIEAEFLEEWKWDGAIYCRALTHKSGLRVEDGGYFAVYRVNGNEVTRRGAGIVKRLLADHSDYCRRQTELRELQKVTEALKARAEQERKTAR